MQNHFVFKGVKIVRKIQKSSLCNGCYFYDSKIPGAKPECDEFNESEEVKYGNECFWHGSISIFVEDKDEKQKD